MSIQQQTMIPAALRLDRDRRGSPDPGCPPGRIHGRKPSYTGKLVWRNTILASIVWIPLIRYGR